VAPLVHYLTKRFFFSFASKQPCMRVYFTGLVSQGGHDVEMEQTLKNSEVVAKAITVQY